MTDIVKKKNPIEVQFRYGFFWVTATQKKINIFLPLKKYFHFHYSRAAK